MSEYCLRWNNHQPNLVKVFSDLLTTEALVDVTLATDGHFIQAHQLVLSACSVYFRDLFMTNNCKHPIVILKDIRIEDLKTIIDFIYRGEVNVCQERLQDVLKVAGSLRIKGLTENQQNVEEVPSHGTLRPLQQASSSSSVRNDLQATSQRSSLTDSREQSLSVEEDINDRDRGSRSPPERKKRKMSSQESSESAPDPIEDSKLGLSDAVKEEPREDRENERSHSRETEPEYNVGGVADAMLMLKSGNGEGGEDSNQGHGGLGSGPGAEGSSGPLSHSQARGKRGVLQRQPGIIRESAQEEKIDEDVQIDYILPDNSLSISQTSNIYTNTSNIVVPSGHHLSSSSTPVTLLQVPAVVVGQRDNLPSMSSTPPLHKSSSQGSLVVHNTGPSIVTKQISHPETSIHRSGISHSQQGPPPMPKQRSNPGVLTRTTTLTSEHGPPSSKSSELQYQLVPVQVYPKPKSLSSSSSNSSQLRPIQPKPPENEMSNIKKELPLIRLTPSDDPGYNIHSPHRLPRALSEEPRHFLDISSELSPSGPSPFIQSVSQDSALDVGMGRMMGQSLSSTSSNVGTSGLTQSSPGHCPVLREGPPLGCNYCWNSSDNHGRVLRRKTKYHCPECRTNLCIVPCFHEYHKQIERQMDTHKQITKILTKQTSSSM